MQIAAIACCFGETHRSLLLLLPPPALVQRAVSLAGTRSVIDTVISPT